MSMVEGVDQELVRRLEPMASIAPERAREVAAKCRRAHVARGRDALRSRDLEGMAIYLIKGELLVLGPDGSSDVLVGGSDCARRPLGSRGTIAKSKAITDIELLEIDEETLHLLLTQDQLSALKPTGLPAGYQIVRSDTTLWRGHVSNDATGFRSARNLLRSSFRTLPESTLDTLFAHCERLRVRRGDRIIRQGDAGDSYYIVESGRCTFMREIGSVTMIVSEMGCSGTFGEESLLTDSPRNATVTMRTDGVLLRLGRQDFDDILRNALLHEVSPSQAAQRMALGARLVDVRFPAEFLMDRTPDAMNIPVNEVRDSMGAFDETREYILTCNNGRRSAAAAFLLAQHGLMAWWAPLGVTEPVPA